MGIVLRLGSGGSAEVLVPHSSIISTSLMAQSRGYPYDHVSAERTAKLVELIHVGVPHRRLVTKSQAPLAIPRGIGRRHQMFSR
jgi:hypothetical protein